MDAERGPRSAVSWLAYLLGEAIAAVTVHALDMTTILLGAASIAPLEGHGGFWKNERVSDDMFDAFDAYSHDRDLEQKSEYN
jgi:hypothetical protein